MTTGPTSAVQLSCPHCSAQFDFEPVTVLAPGSPHLKALVSGTLNCVECPSCHTPLNVPVRLIYRDAARPFLLVQEPRPMPPEQTRAVALKLDEEATASAVRAGVARPVVRLVWSRPEFLEKLFLHEAGFDDRLVEYAKYQLFNGGAEAALSPGRHRLLYDFTRKDAEHLTFLVFDQRTGRPVRVLQVEMSEYRQLEAEFKEQPMLRKELDRAFPGCQVGVERFFGAPTP